MHVGQCWCLSAAAANLQQRAASGTCLRGTTAAVSGASDIPKGRGANTPYIFNAVANLDTWIISDSHNVQVAQLSLQAHQRC